MKPERRRFCVAAVTLPDFRAWGTRTGASQLSFRTRNRIRTNFRDVDGLPLALSVGQLLRVPIRGIRGHLCCYCEPFVVSVGGMEQEVQRAA
jgi:hypothetical protein